MAKGTKERILDTALVMFSQNGYSGTNMRELAQTLGLVKSSLYKHYESKEDIWNSLLDNVEEYYSARFGSEQNMPKVPESTEELIELTMHMIDFTIHDEKVVMVRKVLTTEQYRNERARQIATEHFLVTPRKIYTKIFEEMMKKKVLKKDDPEMLAFAYTAPISAMVHLCDREPEREQEALAKIRAFAEHFAGTYARKN